MDGKEKKRMLEQAWDYLDTTISYLEEVRLNVTVLLDEMKKEKENGNNDEPV